MNGEVVKGQSAEPREIYLYYLGVRLFLVALVLMVVFIKPASYTERSFLIFASALYASAAIFFFLKSKETLPDLLQRILDFAFAIVLPLFAADIVGILPATLVLAAYSVLFWKEYASLLVAVILILMVKTYFLASYPLTDFLISVVYLLGLSLAASKLNLIALLSHKLDRLKAIRLETRRVQKTCANLSADLQVYREAEEILTKLSSMRRFHNLEGVLANLLNAESLKISAEGGKKISSDDALLFQVGQLSVWLRPKHKFLLRDRYYKRKVETVLKMAKPYLESFLAKSR